MHPDDLVPLNSTIELKPIKKISIRDLKGSNYTILKSDGYIEVGSFNENGLAFGDVDSEFFGLIRNLRIFIPVAVKNWIVINDISLK